MWSPSAVWLGQGSASRRRVLLINSSDASPKSSVLRSVWHVAVALPPMFLIHVHSQIEQFRAISECGCPCLSGRQSRGVHRGYFSNLGAKWEASLPHTKAQWRASGEWQYVAYKMADLTICVNPCSTVPGSKQSSRFYPNSDVVRASIGRSHSSIWSVYYDFFSGLNVTLFWHCHVQWLLLMTVIQNDL